MSLTELRHAGHPRTLLVFGIAAAAVLFMGPAAALPQSAYPAPSGTPSLHGLCGSPATPPTRYRHVIWIIMENRNYGEVVGAPVLSTVAARCGLATNYHNLTHPSQPNYIAMTSGRPITAVPSTDCPKFCPVHGQSIFAQTTWHVYAESMPGTCRRTDARPYVVHHTAAPYFVDLTNCAANQVPLTELSFSALPAFSLLVPDVTHDMHEGTSSVAAGDTWLGALLDRLMQSSAYTTGGTAVFVTWDEAGFPRQGSNCAAHILDPGCHVAAYVITPYTVPGSRSSTLFTHYSLLRTTEDLLGLPYLGEAANAASMRSHFRL